MFVLSMSPTDSVASAAKLRDECNNALLSVIALVEEMKPDEFLTMHGLFAVSSPASIIYFLTKFVLDDSVSCVGVI